MSVEAFPTIAAKDALPLPTGPLVFDGLFGWFSPGVTSRGVILCGTLGYEQLSAHRPWRGLAERIAGTGCSVLRFDYPGEGDSGDEGAGDVDALVGSIRRGIRFLREAARAEEIVLVGLRLGGTLAALAASGGGVDRLALLSPFPSGRAYLREIKLQSRSIGRLPDGSPLPEEPGCVSVGGFRIDAAMQAGLSAITLTQAAGAPAPRILVLGDTANLAARWRAAGAEVSTGPLAGLSQLVTNPLFAQAPDEAFSAVVAFAAQGARLRPDPSAAAISLDPLRGETWRERSIRFGEGLFGIHCRPPEPAAGTPTVLFLNSGTNVRSGWGRNTTRLARRLAGQGIASFRVDPGGIGDSAEREDGASPVYRLDVIDDLAAALDALADEASGPVVAVGGCSGAYLAFHALCREPRIDGALLINLYCFDWDPNDDVAAVTRNMFRPPAAYADMLRQGAAWKRLLRGEVRVAAIVGALTKAVVKRLRRMMQPAPAGGSVTRRIADLRRRGARLRLVYSEGDFGLAALREQLGRSPSRVARKLGEPAFIIENADHDLSTMAAQEQLAALLQDFVESFDGKRAVR